MIPYDTLKAIAAQHPYPLVFATLSGAHLYGFPSPDSDFDLRGVLPLPLLLGLEPGEQTCERSARESGLDLDLVTHDAGKFFKLLLTRNGYVLEQLYSPLAVVSTPEYTELKTAASGCITRHHARHYLGFAKNQWNLFLKESPRRVKPLLYVFRVLLTGIHLMRTCRVEANLPLLNGEFRLPYLPDLIAQKTGGEEHAALESNQLPFFEAEYTRLLACLQAAHETTPLPDTPTARPALNDLLIRIRLQTKL